MKTYCNKKPVCRVIEDVGQLCRLCLQRAEEGVPIFNGDDVCAAVALRIMSCVGLQMQQDNALPNKICNTCHGELERYYKFRRKCELSYQKLKYHLLALKQKENNNRIISIRAENVQTDVCSMEQREDVQMVEKEIEDTQHLVIQENKELDEIIEEEKTVEVEELQMPIQAEVNPDIGTFLSGVLVELGILQRSQSGLTVQQDVSELQLEVGGGEQLLLELVLEDDVVQEVDSSQVQNVAVEMKQKPVLMEVREMKAKKSKASKSTEWWCGECGRWFSSAAARARHGRAHQAPRAHACHCGARFTQRASLQRHQALHLEERPYKCKECDKSFTQRGALAAHARAHTAPHTRPLALHRCTTCDKVFLHSSGLSRHRFQHTGRVFACTVCAKQFNDRSSLVRHLKNFCHKAHKRAAGGQFIAAHFEGTAGNMMDVGVKAEGSSGTNMETPGLQVGGASSTLL